MKEIRHKIPLPDTVTISAKLKLDLTKAQYQELREFAKMCQAGKNFVSKISFNKKILNKVELHKLSYQDLRQQYNIPAQIACSIIREVSSQYKSIATTARNKKKLGKRTKSPEKPIKFGSTTINLQSKKDFTFKHESVSIKTLTGRMTVKFSGWNHHLDCISRFGAGGGVLWIDKAKKRVYLIVSIEIPVGFQPLSEFQDFLGIDLGQRKIATTVELKNLETVMYSGKKVLERKDFYKKKRAELQRKGTRSAKRRLIQISGRERRFIGDINHCISKDIIKENYIIGLEDLSGIRENTEPRTNKKHSKKKKDANRKKSQWSFFQLMFDIEYKSYLNGSLVCYVDPWKSSQQCPRCGYTNQENRKNKGEEFLCLNCSLKVDADFVGALNVGMRANFVWNVILGRLSAVPNVSDDEVKAWWRERFQELRWSPDTSLAL